MKTVRLIVLLMLALATMTACVRLEVMFTVNEDGSGTARYVFAMSDDLVEELQDEGDVDFMEELELQELAAFPGAEAREYREDGFTGVAITVPFDDVATLYEDQGVVLENLFEHLSITEENGGWSLSAVVSADEAGANSDDLMLQQALKSGSYVVGASLPGTPDEHNADRVGDDDRLVWEIDLLMTEPRELTATTTEEIKLPVLPILAGSSAVLILALLLAVRFRARRGREEAERNPVGL